MFDIREKKQEKTNKKNKLESILGPIKAKQFL